jgi:hypothetical protein
MKISEMKKDVGRALRLRPHAKQVESYGTGVSVWSSSGPRPVKITADTDYLWYVDAVDEKAGAVTLTCRHTGHQITLANDNIREYRTPDFLMLRCQLLLEESEVRIEPV